jgi:hypothetical protein
MKARILNKYYFDPVVLALNYSILVFLIVRNTWQVEPVSSFGATMYSATLPMRRKPC